MKRLLVTLLGLAFWTGSAAATPRILVVCREDKALRSYDAKTYQLEFSVNLPGDPHDVVASPDGRFAYSSDFGGRPNTLSVVDLNQPTQVTSFTLIPYYKPHSLAITRDGSKIYATCEASRVVAEIDVAARKVARTFKLDVNQAHMLALSPDEKLLLVTSEWDGIVMIVDVEKGVVEKSIASGKGAEGVAISPDGKEGWVVNRVVQSLSVIDIPTGKRVDKISCETNPIRVAITPDGSLVIVTSALSDEIALIDRARRTIVGRIKTGNFPEGLAISKDGSRVYVTNADGGDVAVVDLGKREVIHRFAVGAKPEGIALVE